MTFTIVFLIAFIASFGLRHWLSQRQIRYVAKHRDVVPAEFAEKVTLVRDIRKRLTTLSPNYALAL